MADSDDFRTWEDLERTVRAIATEFKSIHYWQPSYSLSWPDAPPDLKGSPEIDAFPANAKVWEVAEKTAHPDQSPEASEHIDALFGMGSQFHQTHGFYIDGVDENTAKLPDGWYDRAIVRRIDVGGRKVEAIAPKT